VEGNDVSSAAMSDITWSPPLAAPSGAQGMAEETQGSLPLPPLTPPAVPTASPSPASFVSVAVGAASRESEAEVISLSTDLTRSGEVRTPTAVTRDGGEAPGFTRSSAGPPSLLGSLAACFGWRLVSVSLSESSEVQFVLQRPSMSAVKATVKVSGDVCQNVSAQSSTETASRPPVHVNGVAMSLAACATLLRRLSEQHVDTAAEGNDQPSPHCITSHSVACRSTPRTEDSPPARRPPVLTPIESALAARRRAKKRARSRSFSPLSPLPPPPPPQLSSRVHPTTPSALGGISSTSNTGHVVAAPQRAASPSEATQRLIEVEFFHQSRERGETVVNAGSGSLNAASRGADDPASLEPLSSTASISPTTAAPIKTELPPSSVSAVSASSSEPQSRQHRIQKGVANNSNDGSDVPPASPLVGAAATAEATVSSEVLLPARPLAQLNGSPNSPTPTTTVTTMTPSTTSQTRAGGPTSSPPPRSRRAAVSAAVASVSSMGTAVTAEGTAAHTAHSEFSASSTAVHGSAKRSFYMPYLSALHTNLGSSGSSGVCAVNGSTLEGWEASASGATCQPASFTGWDGWSTGSSKNWLAHTHAMSRAIGSSSAVSSFHTAVPVSSPDSKGETEKGGKRRPESGARNGENIHSIRSADVLAAVRVTLSQRWRQRSSLWSHMEESLRLSVGSGRLRGDALEAAVQALQAGMEEQRQYDGMAKNEEGWEEEEVPRNTHSEGTTAVEATECCAFPTIPPRPLLPVSGRTVIEAQHRIAAAEEAEVAIGEQCRDTHHHNSNNGDGHAPRYVVYPGGIPASDRITIDRTYTTRGSYVVVTPSVNNTPCSDDTTIKGEPLSEQDDGASTRAPSLLPGLQANPHEDLHYHIYKCFLTKDMRQALEAEGTLVIGPDGIGPESKATTGRDALPTNAQGSGSKHRGCNAGSDDDDEGDDSGGNAVEEANDNEERDGKVSSPVVKTQTSSAETLPSVDMDHILRYRPAIRRIPMPDVESRYGL
jgi:hypothetical protein